ncbi:MULTISPECIES: pilin [Vibrio]|uniref:Prepilin-type N-terminal cleavage/methylation domain-containing protein n=1 Tax=Vibrio kanaloae TaxID=170673 RepID=A0ABV4LK00_9VIBR|nr:pilin [Vibrio kanaloae]MCG9556193.1 pilin [Vibrio kanaloae]NOI00555.1 pilin [Vibrio kanaloae]OEF13719.1 pilin [Vibrio kanaloae 5S-149]PMM03242.1 pilin [Vibrio kanaloae]
MNNKRTNQKGFTLIELMIVVAVIGVLAAIAIPQYQTYVKKGAAGAAYATATALKTNVEDYIAVNGDYPQTSAAVNATPFSLGTVAVASNDVTVEVTSGGGRGSKVILSRDATNGAWTCALTVSAGVSINGCS